MVERTKSSSNNTLKEYEIPIGDTYKLDARKKLGSGAFGDIYLGKNIRLNEEVAIKLEPTRSRHPQLFYESKLYMALQGGIGIPKLHWCGSQGNYNILIMDLLGPSLEDLFNYCKRKFTLLTTIMIIEQMISRIELHIAYRDGKNLTGTARYASVNTHLGIEQARRDDVEALGYILVYFMKGNLPWQGLKARNMKEKYEKIKEKKISTSLEDLCKGLPDEFKTFIQYSRDLKFEDRPDYSYLKNLARQIAESNNLTFDNNKFDWIVKQNEDRKKEEHNEINNNNGGNNNS